MIKSFKQYQTEAIKSAKYPGARTDVAVAELFHTKAERAVMYTVLGLCGESGEVAEQVKKAFRDDHGSYTTERRDAIKKELGDVLWYLAQTATELGLSLEEIATVNIEKLRRRLKEGKIGGSGSDR